MVQRIKDLCREKGITIAELERRCGIGNGIIARWSKSKPSFERLFKVASELETTVEYLQTGEGQKESPPPIGSELTDPLDIKLMEGLRGLTPDQKELIWAQIQVLKEKK